MAAALVALLVGAAAAMAATGHRPARRPDALIRACVTRAGTLRLLAPHHHCGRHERAVSWRRRGAPGPRGPRGVAGPGAVRVTYRAKARATTPNRTVLALDGLTIRAACRSRSGTTGLRFSMRSRQNATVQVANTETTGTNPNSQSMSTTHVGTLQFSLRGGRPFAAVGGPNARTGYDRALIDLVYATRSHVITMDLGVLVDVTHGTCTLNGTAVPG